MTREIMESLRECWQSEYAEHYLATLREKEAARPVIKLKSPQLMYRGYLIMRMRRACSRLLLGGRVLHGAVRLLDVFMDDHEIPLDLLLQIALVCLLIAAKFEMKGIRVPRFAELCSVSGADTVAPETLWGLEWNVLQHLRWDLTSPTAATFLDFYSPAAVSVDDYKHWCKQGDRSSVTFQHYQDLTKERMRKFLNITLLDMRLAKVTPSLVAAACVQAARSVLGLPHWPDSLHRLTTHPLASVLPLSTRLASMVLIKSSARKREYSDDEDDLGYGTAMSSPESISKRRRSDSYSP